MKKKRMEKFIDVDKAPINCLVFVTVPPQTKFFAIFDRNGDPVSYCGAARKAALKEVLKRKPTEAEVIEFTFPATPGALTIDY